MFGFSWSRKLSGRGQTGGGVFSAWRGVAAKQHAGMTAPYPADTLVYSVREGEGEFFSRDVPGGVETSPVLPILALRFIGVMLIT